VPDHELGRFVHMDFRFNPVVGDSSRSPLRWYFPRRRQRPHRPRAGKSEPWRRALRTRRTAAGRACKAHDEPLWNALHARARSRKTTISELIREAVRERYLGSRDEPRKAMREFVGIRKERPAAPDAVEYVRSLRRGGRLDRLRSR
jgi:hypothetical protein